MKAAIFNSTPAGPTLAIREVPRPQLKPGHVILRVLACGVCRTDLHIYEGDLPPLPNLILCHQIDCGTCETVTQTTSYTPCYELP
ncbi:MAG TPA: alcohol dehydrogenase catalytic domain-containing protein [Edaphobacter sp.]